MAIILQTTFSNSFPWMKMLEFWLNFHWNVFLGAKLMGSQQWAIKISLKYVSESETSIGVMAWCHQAMNHYVIQSQWLKLRGTRPQWVKATPFHQEYWLQIVTGRGLTVWNWLISSSFSTCGVVSSEALDCLPLFLSVVLVCLLVCLLFDFCLFSFCKTNRFAPMPRNFRPKAVGPHDRDRNCTKNYADCWHSLPTAFGSPLMRDHLSFKTTMRDGLFSSVHVLHFF